MPVLLYCQLKNGPFEGFILLHASYDAAVILVVEQHLSNAVGVGCFQF